MDRLTGCCCFVLVRHEWMLFFLPQLVRRRYGIRKLIVKQITQ